MAYAAVTSLMETLSLHFLQSQPRLPIEDLEAQIRIGNENVGLLQQIVEAQMKKTELDEEAPPKFLIKVNYYPEMKKLIKSKKLAESSSQNERMINAWDSKLLTSRLREVGEVKQKIVSLHRNLGLLQQSLEKSEIRDVRVMKDLEAQIRDASFKLEARIEMELRTIYLAKGSLHITPCLLRRHGIFNEAEEQTGYQITENLGLLEKIVEAQIKEIELNEEASSSKCLRICKKACLPGLYGNQQLARLREVGKVKQEMVLHHQNLGSLQESEIDNYEVNPVKHAEIREWINNAEQIGNEMELTTFYLAKDSLLHITDCLLRLHEIFIEAEKQIDYHRNELIRIQTEYQQLAKAASSQNQRLTDVSLLGRIRRRGLQLVKGSSLHHLVHKKIIVTNFSKNTSKFDGGMVGCEKLFEKILDQLLTQQTTTGRQVVSIVGMGGIGKTTLARKVYEDSSVTSHFDKQAWVTVSQKFNKEQMLRCLIACVTAASRDELHKQSTDQDKLPKQCTNQLSESVYKCLKGQRYLIVIDDIWSTTTWDSVQRCFPDDNNGSRILLTSRLKEVAEYASSGNSPLNMPFLDADESWNLYCKVFGKTEFLRVFEKIGRDIVEKCKGLPLAITIVASLLCKLEEEEEKWKNVAKSVMGNSSDACSRILYLSYNQLPYHLKACFLYFGIFEEDYEISVKKLVRLWAAEGFLSTVEHMNLEKVAMECLQDLVDRSLVIVSKQSYNREIKKIRIHDLLRDLCLREARLENLLNVNGVIKPCRWISLTSGSFYDKVRFEDECFHKFHSFHSTLSYYFWDAKIHVERLFSHLKLLRVVEMRNRYWDDVIKLNMLENLVHLRYLALSMYNRSQIKIFEHWNMQSLIISGEGAIFDSCKSSGIWNMPLLRNFCVEGICSLETPSVVYRNLENISWLDSMLCTKDLFTMIPNLKTLGVDGGYNVDNLDCFSNFVHLEQLEKLSIRRLMELNLVMCCIPLATCLPNLKKLSFLESDLQWRELRAISMLPNLEVLKLINACEGKEWKTSSGGFQQLKRLVIEKTDLQYWNAVGDHFPMLKCLEISKCFMLEEIPRGFVDITTLALIKLSYCWDSLEASAKWIQDKQRNNYGTDDLLVRSENIGVRWVSTSLFSNV